MSFKVRMGLRCVIIRDRQQRNEAGQIVNIWADDSMNFWLRNNVGAKVVNIQYTSNCDSQGNSINAYSVFYYPSVKAQKLLDKGRNEKKAIAKVEKKSKMKKLAISM